MVNLIHVRQFQLVNKETGHGYKSSNRENEINYIRITWTTSRVGHTHSYQLPNLNYIVVSIPNLLNYASLINLLTNCSKC